MDIKDLAGFSEPAKELISRCSDALGAMAHPYQIVRIAKAESKAEIIKTRNQIEVGKIKALGAIEISEVEERALARLVHEEGRKQQNIENVLANALPELKEDAKPQEVSEDWLHNFFDKCRLVSDPEMQALWGKVLAGEANAAGSFSKRTVNLIQSLEKEDAENFQLLCRFSIDDGKAPLIYDLREKIYSERGLKLDTMNDLQSLGLIVYNSSEYSAALLDDGPLSYFFDAFFVKLPKELPSRFRMGKVLLTNLGKQLVGICSLEPVDGFANYLVGTWTSFGYEVTRVPSETKQKETT